MKYRIKSMTVGVAVASVLVCAQAAQAREHHHRHRHHHHHYAHSAHREMRSDSFARRDWARADFGYRERSTHRRAHHSRDLGASVLGGGAGPRPAAWCGWAMRQLVGHDPGPSYNLARNWAHWGHPGPAGVGAIVVWPHHVGKIVGQQNGKWIVQSGNDGHRLRIRPRSIAGAIAIRWG